MNAGKLRFWLALLLLSGAVAVIVRQHQEAKRLASENDILRAKSAEAIRLQHENERLAGALAAGQKAAESQIQELARLRAKSAAATRSEQENVKLKMDLARLTEEAAAAAPAPGVLESVEVRERKQLMARMSFGKTIALSLMMFADDHDGKLPNDLSSIAASLDASPEFSHFGFKTAEYDLLLSDQLYATREPASTILAREKKPAALSDGRFGKSYVFADGHVEMVKKNSSEEFLEWEREHTEQKQVP